MARHIKTEMITYIDKKLTGNGLADHALKTGDARLMMRLAAQVCVGIREVGGNNTGPMVTLIQETVGGPDHVAWCMSFVQTCIAYAEFRCRVQSPVFASEHCQTVWNETPIAQRVKFSPLAGAIAVWKHGTSSSGHTGIVDSCDTKTFHAFEGNTESGIVNGKVERDGGGIYWTSRSLAGNGDMHLLGFLKPF